MSLTRLNEMVTCWGVGGVGLILRICHIASIINLCDKHVKLCLIQYFMIQLFIYLMQLLSQQGAALGFEVH